MKTLWSSLGSFRHAQSGVAAVELAVAVPILTVCALCAGDLGRFALQRTWVSYAASAGAEYAVANADNSFQHQQDHGRRDSRRAGQHFG